MKLLYKSCIRHQKMSQRCSSICYTKARNVAVEAHRHPVRLFLPLSRKGPCVVPQRISSEHEHVQKMLHYLARISEPEKIGVQFSLTTELSQGTYMQRLHPDSQPSVLCKKKNGAILHALVSLLVTKSTAYCTWQSCQI